MRRDRKATRSEPQSSSRRRSGTVRRRSSWWSRSRSGRSVIQVLDVPTYIWAPPSLIAQTIAGELLGAARHHGGVTLMETMVGFFFAVVLGLGVRVPAPFLDDGRGARLYPLLIASQSIPTVVLAPVFVLVLGFGLVAEGRGRDPLLLLPASSSARSTGCRGVDPEYIRMMLTLDATRMGDLPTGRVPGGPPADLHRDARRPRPTRRSEPCSASGPARNPASAGRCSRRKAGSTHALVFADIVFITVMALGAVRRRVARRATDHPLGAEGGVTEALDVAVLPHREQRHSGTTDGRRRYLWIRRSGTSVPACSPSAS